MSEKPVFVDVSGRRRVRLRWAGIGVGVVLGGYLAVVMAGMVLGVSVPYAPWPTGGGHRPHGTAQNGSLHPVGGGGVPSPGPNVSPFRSSGTGATPRPSTSASSAATVPVTVPAIASTSASPIPTSAKTKGKSAGAPGHTKSPNPHAHK